MENTIEIKLKDREGKVHSLVAPTDMALNLMEVCKLHELPVEGTCGGMAMCASCHCFVLSKHELPEMSNDEEGMLEQLFTLQDNSRLGCQLAIAQDLDGLEVELAPEE